MINFQTTDPTDIPGGIVAIKLYSNTCVPCKALAPFFEKITNATLGGVNMDEENSFMIDFGIRSVPTVLVFKDKELKGKVVGNKIEEITKLIDSLE